MYEYNSKPSSKIGRASACKECHNNLQNEKYKKKYPPKEIELFPEGMDKCTICKEIKLISEFQKDKRKSSGYVRNCRKCINKKHKERSDKIKEENKLNPVVLVGSKKCIACGKEKDISEFVKSNKEKDGITSLCKKCKNKIEKERISKYKEENLNKEFDKNNLKQCNRCGFIKTLHNFFVSNSNKDGFASSCKDCILSYQKSFYEENKVDVLPRRKAYRESNRDTIVEKLKIDSRKSARYETYKDKLTIVEDVIEGNDGELLSRCYFCKEYFTPTNAQVRARVQSLKRSQGGEAHIYCSESCKEKCDVYWMQKIPKSLRKFSPQNARCDQSTNRLVLLELQTDSFGFNFCEICGEEFDRTDLRLHHTIMVSKDKSEANNMAHQMIICKYHHDELHRNCK